MSRFHHDASLSESAPTSVAGPSGATAGKSGELLLAELWDIGERLEDARRVAARFRRADPGESPRGERARSANSERIAHDEQATAREQPGGGHREAVAARRPVLSFLAPWLFHAGLSGSVCGLALFAWGTWGGRAPLLMAATPCLLAGLAAILTAIACGGHAAEEPPRAGGEARNQQRTIAPQGPVILPPHPTAAERRLDPPHAGDMFREPLAEVDELLPRPKRVD